MNAEAWQEYAALGFEGLSPVKGVPKPAPKPAVKSTAKRTADDVLIALVCELFAARIVPKEKKRGRTKARVNLR